MTGLVACKQTPTTRGQHLNKDHKKERCCTVDKVVLPIHLQYINMQVKDIEADSFSHLYD